MTTQSIRLGIVVVAAAVIVLDLYLVFDRHKGNTYSEILRSWFLPRAWLYYLTAFMIGVLLGHWGPK